MAKVELSDTFKVCCKRLEKESFKLLFKQSALRVYGEPSVNSGQLYYKRIVVVNNSGEVYDTQNYWETGKLKIVIAYTGVISLLVTNRVSGKEEEHSIHISNKLSTVIVNKEASNFRGVSVLKAAYENDTIWVHADNKSIYYWNKQTGYKSKINSPSAALSSSMPGLEVYNNDAMVFNGVYFNFKDGIYKLLERGMIYPDAAIMGSNITLDKQKIPIHSEDIKLFLDRKNGVMYEVDESRVNHVSKVIQCIARKLGSAEKVKLQVKIRAEKDFGGIPFQSVPILNK